MFDETAFLEPGASRRKLVIAIHGYANGAKRLKAVRRVIGDSLPDADIFAPELPFARNFICVEPVEDIVVDLMDRIDALVAKRKSDLQDDGYEEIILVGHSFGAVIARKIAILANGEQRTSGGDVPAPFENKLARFQAGRPWAALIRRIVLLAGMNRGWSASSAMNWLTSVKWSAMEFFGETVLAFFVGKPTAFAIRKGAPFLVQTRLQWLALMNRDYGPRPDLITVQLLGTIDDLVSPDDNVDYVIDDPGYQGGGGPSFYYLEVPESDHSGIVEMAGNSSAAVWRATKFAQALTFDRSDLTRQSIPRRDMADSLPPPPNPNPINVVFVIHGIRDKGFWTQKIARKIKECAANAGKDFESFTESYGYFAILPFLAPLVRQRKVEWLMDRYAEVRARYPHPDTKFYYVGHSNGTYLAAHALDDYPAVRFERIVFAGSVVRKDFVWSNYTGVGGSTAPRVKALLNFVATGDWVVALFPKALQPWRWFNLGSAGHDGFDAGSATGPIYQYKYIKGRHDAALVESNWETLANFIVSGTLPSTPSSLWDGKQNWFWKAAGVCSYVLFPVFALAVLLFGAALFLSMFGPAPCEWFAPQWSICTAQPTVHQAATRAIMFFLYLWGVYLFVTRF